MHYNIITHTALLLSAALYVGSAAYAGEYKGDLLLKDVAEKYSNYGHHDPGHTEFELIEPYTYVTDDGAS